MEVHTGSGGVRESKISEETCISGRECFDILRSGALKNNGCVQSNVPSDTVTLNTADAIYSAALQSGERVNHAHPVEEQMKLRVILYTSKVVI